jgi:hypothetical protein
MTTETPVTSRLLPVSILAGPSVKSLLRDIVASNSQCHFGVLTSSSADFQTTHEGVLVEELVAANSGGYDPKRIKAQISSIAEKDSVSHLLIECDSKTHPIALASLFLPDGADSQRFSEIARLSSTLVSADSETLLSSLVYGNRAAGVTSPCILADQIECADVVVLGGKPSDSEFLLARAVVSALNPRGRILPGTC